jgi:N-acetylglucosaminyl-diphospho-decaprenol L-rhamnosyltransferase
LKSASTLTGTAENTYCGEFDTDVTTSLSGYRGACFPRAETNCVFEAFQIGTKPHGRDGRASMLIPILVLNYNGRHLLAECLPSVVKAAEQSRYECEVIVIDNDSTDDSLAWLQQKYPNLRVIRCENRALCSFNEVVPSLNCDVAVLLNNDVKLAAGAIDPLVEPLLRDLPAGDPNCFMTAPLCWQMDGQTCEGLKTSVRWRWGLVQATGRFPGHETAMYRADLTASAGAAMAIDCRVFTEIGGFDPLYLPGRIEDLDFCYRGFVAGFHGRYVPESVAYHHGMASFGPAYGHSGNDHLALRNTLLFQWKNLRHPAHRLRHWLTVPLRVVWDLARAPFVGRRRRLAFLGALFEAVSLWRKRRPQRAARGDTAREREFFRRFHPTVLLNGDPAAEIGAVRFYRIDTPDHTSKRQEEVDDLQHEEVSA